MQDMIFVVEGATDLSASLSLGMEHVVGRPSCSGGVAEIQRIIRQGKFRGAVIVADNDDPGLRGAKMLQGHLAVPSVIVVLPAKDLRQFLNLGGTLDDLNSIVSGLAWKQPSTRCFNG